VLEVLEDSVLELCLELDGAVVSPAEDNAVNVLRRRASARAFPLPWFGFAIMASLVCKTNAIIAVELVLWKFLRKFYVGYGVDSIICEVVLLGHFILVVF